MGEEYAEKKSLSFCDYEDPKLSSGLREGRNLNIWLG